TRLAAAETDAAVAVADSRQRGEGEDATTFHHLGYAVYLNQLFLQAFFILGLFVSLCHKSRSATLEFQTAFAGCLSQCLDATVEQIAATIKSHFGDTCLLGALGDQLADLLGRFHVSTLALTQGGGRSQNPVVRRDHLGVDVSRA